MMMKKKAEAAEVAALHAVTECVRQIAETNVSQMPSILLPHAMAHAVEPAIRRARHHAILQARDRVRQTDVPDVLPNATMAVPHVLVHVLEAAVAAVVPLLVKAVAKGLAQHHAA